MFAASDMRDKSYEITRQKGSVKTLTLTPNNLTRDEDPSAQRSAVVNPRLIRGARRLTTSPG
jgi:hypothetical protein